MSTDTNAGRDGLVVEEYKSLWQDLMKQQETLLKLTQMCTLVLGGLLWYGLTKLDTSSGPGKDQTVNIVSSTTNSLSIASTNIVSSTTNPLSIASTNIVSSTTNPLSIASPNRPTSPSERLEKVLKENALSITLMMSALISGAFCVLLANVQTRSYAITAYMALRDPKPNWSQINNKMLDSPPSVCTRFGQTFSLGKGRILFDFITYGPILMIELACFGILVRYAFWSWMWVPPIPLLCFQWKFALSSRPRTIYDKMKKAYDATGCNLMDSM